MTQRHIASAKDKTSSLSKAAAAQSVADISWVLASTLVSVYMRTLNLDTMADCFKNHTPARGVPGFNATVASGHLHLLRVKQVIVI